ncbi:hypothetical protein NQ317_004717 [Molorchus minor]|uniref:Uncharacterized protein n=1 Tax=Molorchus minor TaxID=1323400 RepID=A0ABQ9JR57_9CUCU|nr:hypothetical protein NQ317_004717 [Molorchus minor]
MPHIDILFSQLQKIETDVIKIQKCIDNFQKEVAQIRDDLPPLTNDPLYIDVKEETPKKRRRLNQENINMSVREVCDIIAAEEKYKEYKKTLPLEDINQFCEAYPMIDKDILKMELSIFYSRKEITENSSEFKDFPGVCKH